MCSFQCCYCKNSLLTIMFTTNQKATLGAWPRRLPEQQPNDGCTYGKRPQTTNTAAKARSSQHLGEADPRGNQSRKYYPSTHSPSLTVTEFYSWDFRHKLCQDPRVHHRTIEQGAGMHSHLSVQDVPSWVDLISCPSMNMCACPRTFRTARIFGERAALKSSAMASNPSSNEPPLNWKMASSLVHKSN